MVPSELPATPTVKLRLATQYDPKAKAPCTGCGAQPGKDHKYPGKSFCPQDPQSKVK